MQKSLTGGLLLISLTLGGCIIAPGDHDASDRDERGSIQPTIGQELLDLDRARAGGVISTSEYERTKERILERN